MYDTFIERPLTQCIEALQAVELTYFLWHMPEGVAEHSFFRLQPSVNLHAQLQPVQLLWYPMYYPGMMNARVSPVQWSEPHSILAPNQDSNPGGRIQKSGNTTLVQLSDTKFLWIILYSYLSWSEHINIVVNKISKNVGIIAKVRHLLPTSHTCMFYKTLLGTFYQLL